MTLARCSLNQIAKNTHANTAGTRYERPAQKRPAQEKSRLQIEIEMNLRVAAVLLLLFFGGEICAQTNDEVLDECENAGKKAGLDSVSQGCQAVKDKCPQKEVFEKSVASPVPNAALLPGLVRDSCKTLYKTSCLRTATEGIKTGADDMCRSILQNGPGTDEGECNSISAAYEIYQSGLTSCRTFPDGLGDVKKDPCDCAEDGFSGGIDTGRPGCKEHGAAFDHPGFFCYVVSPKECKDAKITESTKFPGAFWKDCE